MPIPIGPREKMASEACRAGRGEPEIKDRMVRRLHVRKGNPRADARKVEREGVIAGAEEQ